MVVVRSDQGYDKGIIRIFCAVLPVLLDFLHSVLNSITLYYRCWRIDGTLCSVIVYLSMFLSTLMHVKSCIDFSREKITCRLMKKKWSLRTKNQIINHSHSPFVFMLLFT